MFNVPPAALANGGRARARPRGAAAAFAHLISYRGAMVPMIGASAAISGMMAAAMRLCFSKADRSRSGGGRAMENRIVFRHRRCLLRSASRNF
jgi:hypothetical protein